MYSDKNKKRISAVFLLLAALVIAAAVWLLTSGSFGRTIEDEGTAAVRDAVRRSALQCYAVEGDYPPTLEYLEENYGLKVNTRDYFIRYEIFASNIAPQITVTGKR